MCGKAHCGAMFVEDNLTATSALAWIVTRDAVVSDQLRDATPLEVQLSTLFDERMGAKDPRLVPLMSATIRGSAFDLLTNACRAGRVQASGIPGSSSREGVRSRGGARAVARPISAEEWKRLELTEVDNRVVAQPIQDSLSDLHWHDLLFLAVEVESAFPADEASHAAVNFAEPLDKDYSERPGSTPAAPEAQDTRVAPQVRGAKSLGVIAAIRDLWGGDLDRAPKIKGQRDQEIVRHMESHGFPKNPISEKQIRRALDQYSSDPAGRVSRDVR
jgi:hypothetical protein